VSRGSRSALQSFRAVAAVAAAFAVSTLLLLLSGIDPLAALGALVGGALGDRFALGDTVVKTCPLLVTGLGVALAFRAGVWNIGAEGQLLVGALAATAVGRACGGAPFPLPLLAALAGAAVAGALWAGIAAALRVYRNVNEIVATIMLNFVAARLLGWAVHGPLMEAAGRYPQSDPIPPAALLPLIVGRVHAGVLLALLLAAASWALLFRTGAGFRWRVVGENARAARVAGFSPERAVLEAMLTSGALAGLAGAFEVLGVTGRLFEQLSGGGGYTAIAVALTAGLHPGGVTLAALFFGALAAGSGAMQRVAGVSAVFVAIVQAATLLAILALETPRPRRAAAESR
jgi:simple sugar transport system permease protein